MFNKIYNFIFPVGGGTIGAITRLPQVAEASSHSHIVIETIIVAAIGALVGLIVKKLFDILWPRIFPKKKDI
ncbi:unnamed protein product [marine sediment metagenome]|uniref:Uncharacterized protein n=1 Tax=marine sediment metagenome TaxID=412755 RepID=X1VML6_9ZZZZ